MDKTKILDFIKHNAFALCCGLVAVLAVVASFYPFGGMVTALSAKASEEAAPYQSLTGLVHSRKFPQVDPTKATPVELTGFPNHDQVEAGKAAVAKLASESTASLTVLEQRNDDKLVHPLLVADALPSPVSDTPKFTFAQVYKNVLSIDPTMSGLGSPTVPPPVQANGPQPTPMAVDERLQSVRAVNLCNDILRAGVPADLKLLEARKQWLKSNVYDPQLIQDNAGAFVNSAEVQQKMTADFLQLPDKLNAEIAARSHVYLDPNAFAVNPSILSAATPQMTDIWFAQLSLWVQTDIAKAVAAANAGLDSVASPMGSAVEVPAASVAATSPDAPVLRGVAASPVKRILRLDMKPIPMYQFALANGGPAALDETAILAPVYTVSPTGRTSNKMYDVVPFRLTVDVEADHVNRFISTLTRDRLIYVYNEDLFSIDPSTLAPQGFQYGSRPVVRLILSGEELFLRKWTVPVMPPQIKYHLGVEPPPPGSKVLPWGGGGADTAQQPGFNPEGGMPGMAPPGGM